MSRYASAIYGNDFYGNPTSFGFQVVGFIAKPTNYNTLSLSWQNSDGLWDRIRLVRSATGFPAHVTDGVVLIDANTGPTATAPLDSSVGSFQDNNLVPGLYYYSLFLRSTSGALKWTRAGDAYSNAISDMGYLDYLLDRLPSVLTASTGGNRATSQLAKFLSIPAFHMSEYRSLLDGLLDVNDPDSVPGPLLPSLMSQVGYAYEPEIGMRQNRILARNAAYLSKIKGTALGLTGLSSSVTGFSSRIRPFTNLLLSQDDSSADSTIGAWTVTGATLTRSAAVTPPDADNTLNTYAQYTTEINRPGNFQVTATDTAASVLLGAASPVRTGIPVTTGVAYTFSAYFQSAATARQPTLAIRWYDKTGALISTSSSTALDVSSTTAWVRNSWTATAPALALFAAASIAWTTAVSEVQYFDAAQFERAGVATAYRTSRRIEVALTAERVNEIINGGFDLTIAGFAVTNGSAVHTTTGTFDGGVGALDLTMSAGTATVSQADVVVDPDRPFVVQGKFLHTTGLAMSVVADVQYFTSAGVSISTQTGTVFTNAGALTGWVLPRFVGRTPATAGKATVRFTVTAASGSVIRVDDVAAEHADLVQDYFDRRNNSGDVIFEGAVNGSRAHLYRLLGPKRARFLDLAEDATPIKSGINVVLATPRTP